MRLYGVEGAGGAGEVIRGVEDGDGGGWVAVRVRGFS